jgi:hypothetical protein
LLPYNDPRVNAAMAILDRGHGKPHEAAEVTQTVAMNVRTTRTLDVSHMTDEAELDALERALDATVAPLEVPASTGDGWKPSSSPKPCDARVRRCREAAHILKHRRPPRRPY